jgi:2-phosphosulfolactate phosphatase
VPADWFTQAPYGVRFEWGPSGAARVVAGSACLVVVDVLSFTTAVSVAVDAGTRVYPYPWRDRTAATFAAENGAALAVGRRSVSPATPWSLSPAALRRAPSTPRLVLPSPNGSAIAAAVAAQAVVAGCLRNASAVGGWLAGRGFGTPQRPLSVKGARRGRLRGRRRDRRRDRRQQHGTGARRRRVHRCRKCSRSGR